MRIAVSLAAALVVAACGFRPAGAPGGDPAAEAGRAGAGVRVQPIPERVGQLVRGELVRRLHPGDAPRKPAYVLSVSLDERVTDTGFRRDESETRRNIRLAAEYTLRDAATGERILKGSTRLTTSANVLDQPYATRAMRRDARERGARAVAERIARDVTSKLRAADAS